MFYGSFGYYEEYYAFGGSSEEVKKLLWRMFCNNCYDRPDKEMKRVFNEEACIDEYNAPGIIKPYGFSTADRGRLYTLSGNKLVELKEV